LAELGLSVGSPNPPGPLGILMVGVGGVSGVVVLVLGGVGIAGELMLGGVVDDTD
jgi:hypothetical protein